MRLKSGLLLVVWMVTSGSLLAAERGSGYLGVTPTSALPASFLAPSVEAGFFLGESFSVGAAWGRSQFEYGFTAAEEEHQGMMTEGWGHMTEERWNMYESRLDLPQNAQVTGNHRSYGVKARWFLSERFNLLFATAWKETTGTLDVPVGSAGLTARGDFVATSQVSNFGLGSQWSFDRGWFFGVDWAVGAAASQESVTVTLAENSSLSTADQQTAKTQIEAFATSINQLLSRSGGLTLFMGWSF